MDSEPDDPEARMRAAATAPRPLGPGDVLDGFYLEERTHMGGMAHIWRVHPVDEPHPMPMIMKVPRLKGGDDPATIVGFEVEQMIMPLLKGPHVPRFVARGEDPARPYIVMERIEGESLKPQFDASPLPIDRVIDLGTRVALALHDLHRQQVIHLDLKPSNIMFRKTGEAVLVDFGLSHHLQLPDLLDEEFELPLGTGPYMSPEQIQFMRSEPRSDLFALGVMLYHLTTGERPFGAPHNVRGLRKRLWRDPVPPRALRPDCPPWLQELILRCIQVRAEHRPARAADLAFDLQNPGQVALTELATRSRGSSGWQAFTRWARAIGQEPQILDHAPPGVSAPIVMVAVDVNHAEDDLLESLRDQLEGMLRMRPQARLACVSIMKTHRVALDDLVDADGRSTHMRLLVQLKHWARPLTQLELGHRITYHVLEAYDVASALLDYAQKANVDHLVIGARSSGRLRRYLGSVSAEVAAKAPMSVTIVRTPPRSDDDLDPETDPPEDDATRL